MKCINHYFRMQNTVSLPNHGNCSICQPDEHNRHCCGYVPVNITIHSFNVESRKTDLPTTRHRDTH